MKNLIIVVLAALLMWFGTTLVRVENERYALLLDMCHPTNNEPVLGPDCEGVETRSSWTWHLAYALGIL